MDKARVDTSLFVGSWDQFVLRFPQKAHEYKQEESSFQEHAIADAQKMVMYVPPYFEGTITLTGYPLLFSVTILKIIIIIDTKKPVTVEEQFFREQSCQQLMHIVLSEGAQCLYAHQFSLQGDNVFVRATSTTLYSAASFNYSVMYAGTASITHYYDSFIRGHNANTVFNGVYCATQKQIIKLFSAVYHYAPYTKSKVLVKGIVADWAYVVYKGCIFIDNAAHNTEAAQENKTLIVGDYGSVNSVPVLEVLNNEVQCAHASAVGRVDQQHIMYLRSRGFSLVQAQRMIINSYVSDVFNSDVTALLKEKLRKIINLLPVI